MRRVFVIGAKRTAIGTFGGSLKDIPAPILGAEVSKEVIKQAKVRPEEIDQVIVGNVLMANQGMGPGRQVGIYAGIPPEKPGYTVNMLCGSGMKAVMIGASEIRWGESDLVLSVGIENMSQAPFYVSYKARFGLKFGDMKMEDGMLKDGLIDVFNNVHMGSTAEKLAEDFKISRKEQDEFAYLSQMKTKEAIEKGYFKEEIVPLEIKEKKGIRVFDIDEHPKPDVTLEKLSKLKPVFKKDGTVTAGNASGLNDGASALLLASEDYVSKNNLKPLAELIDWSQAGIDPMYMGLGPVKATEKLLKKARISFQDIELIELNEAFAVQSLAVLMNWEKLFGIKKEEILEITNVNGGAIALGHPIGASGNRIIVTLIYALKRLKKRLGLATLCIGGGMGTAILVKVCEEDGKCD